MKSIEPSLKSEYKKLEEAYGKKGGFEIKGGNKNIPYSDVATSLQDRTINNITIDILTHAWNVPGIGVTFDNLIDISTIPITSLPPTLRKLKILTEKVKNNLSSYKHSFTLLPKIIYGIGYNIIDSLASLSSQSVQVLFKIFNDQLDNNPVFVRLWCCNSGTAIHEIKNLPNGSVLLTYGHPNENQDGFNLMDNIQSFLRQNSNTPLNNIVDNFFDISFEELGIATHFQGKEFILRLQNNIKDILKHPREIMRKNMLKLKKFNDILMQQDWFCKKWPNATEIVIPEIGEDTIKLYQKNIIIHLIRKHEAEVIEAVKEYQSLDSVRSLIEKQFPDLLVTSLDRGRFHFVKFLLSFDRMDKDIYSIALSKLYTLKYSLLLRTEATKTLLEYGADPNITNESGKPIFVTIMEEYTSTETIEAIKIFLDYGAKISEDLLKVVHDINNQDILNLLTEYQATQESQTQNNNYDGDGITTELSLNETDLHSSTTQQSSITVLGENLTIDSNT